jgi:DNA-binding helix-hairpin-helix protein with protein kinase domain
MQQPVSAASSEVVRHGDGIFRRQFLCGVARPEFAAPELAEVNLRSQPREAASDLFALAVHIYQLLLGGNHPFMRGVWTGAGDQPHALELAKTGCWAGGPGSPLATHPLAPTASFLPADLVGLFERAFTDGARDPARRPGAADWRRALLSVRTTSCRRGVHQIPVDAAACAWCAVDDVRARRKQRTAPSSGEDIDPQVISDTPDPTRRTTTATPKSSRPPAATTDIST